MPQQKRVADDFIPDDFAPDQEAPAVAADPQLDKVRQLQAAKYPTAAERGAPAGTATLAPDDSPVPIKLGPFQTSVNMPQAMRGLLGGAASVVNTAMPAGSTPRPSTEVPMSPMEQFGSNVTATMLAGKGAIGLKRGVVDPLLAKARHYRAGGKIPYIEQQLAPRGAEAQALASDVAPVLAQDPQMAAAKGPKFVQLISDRFKNAGAELHAAEQSVPRGTTVLKKPLLDQLDSAIDNLRVQAANTPEVPFRPSISAYEPQQSQFISGHGDALRELGNARNELAKLPDKVPFEDLRKYRLQLDDAISTHSGWSETASAADKAAMKAKQTVANIVRGSMKGFSKELDVASDKFSTAADAMNAAGIDWNRLRRLREVGKLPPTSRAMKAAKAVGKTVGTATLGAAGYRYLAND